MEFVLDSASFSHKLRYSEEPNMLEVFEIRFSDSSYELHRLRMPDAAVGLWSTQNFFTETGAPAVLRLVCVRIRGAWDFDTRGSSLDILLENFKLEKAYRYSMALPAVFTPVPVHQTEHSDTATFSLCTPWGFGIAWKHDDRSGRTEAVCWGNDWSDGAMWRVMNQTKAWARHPLFLALVASIMLGKLMDDYLDTESTNIKGVEARTRYHGFSDLATKITEGDYNSLSQKMSGCAGILALLERTYKVLNEFLGDMSLYSQRYDVDDDPSLRGIRLEVEECIETLRKRLKVQKIELDYLSQRVEVQLTAVRVATFITQMSMFYSPMSLANPLPKQLFHLISQQETRVGIAVAEDSRTLASASKEDSTAMKTIAAVTIVFLPGTFIAALFAMPLFQWDAVGDTKVVSNRFWIYWAVTVPLTCLTLLFWVLWTKRQARMHRSSEKRAREELRSDIEGQSKGVEKKEV